MRDRKVLLVGGDLDVMRTLQVYLETHRFTVQVTLCADEALRTCHESPPDIVILDWQLPDIDGHRFCQQIRTSEGARDTFILALLSANERQLRLAALEAGANDVVAPPLDIEQVRLRIEEFLRP